jgi:putative transcriptional regulator
LADDGHFLDYRHGVGALEVSMKNRLRELRNTRGWSQADLANELKVSRQTVNAIETEKYDPSLPLAFRVARLFALRIEDIFEDRNGTVAK